MIAGALAGLLQRAVGAAHGISMLALAAMTLVTILDVAGRYIFNRPLLGALELSEIMLVLLVFGGFAYTERQGGHVDVDVVVLRFPRRARALCETAAALLSTALWGAIAWRTGVQALVVQRAGETTANLSLPASPFVWAAAVGCALFALTLLGRTIEAGRRLVQP